MVPANLDAGKASLQASDGYRCQYNDPDWIHSNSYGLETCFLGASETHANAFHWQVVDGEDDDLEGRSYAGRHSVWMGVAQEDPLKGELLTVPLGTLEGIVTAEPVNLAVGKVCEITRTTACKKDRDCPAGEGCVNVMPELSFKHQISLPDYRAVPLPEGHSIDGGAVMVQLVNPRGKPTSEWIKLEAFANGYDQQRDDGFIDCMFDPIDDGNTEDDFFDPTDPERRLGPSTLCYNGFVFACLGNTYYPYDPDKLCGASGPGLQGETGPGTWVESRFDLSPFRGRSILIRFISSGIKISYYWTYETFEEFSGTNPTPVDDGWWIDDITVRDTLAEPALLSVDTKENPVPAARSATPLRRLERR
jgi:hypothetical protein